MRQMLLALTAIAAVLSAPLAVAAPTCQNRGGDTVRCGTGDAMPVGWRLPARELEDRQMAALTPSVMREIGGVVLFVGALFALIALMPDFDGQGWDEQEGDHREPK